MAETGGDAEIDNGLLTIDVDADDYADTAADDTVNVSRTYQSEDAFQAEKRSYTAKIHGEPGTNYQELMTAVPALSQAIDTKDTNSVMAAADSKVKLGKKDVHLLGYVVGEMYYDREFRRILGLCEVVRGVCVVDAGGKLEGSLGRWEGRCRERLGTAEGV